jgi:hypothetical protein
MQPLDRGLLLAELVGEQDVLPEPDDVMESECSDLLVPLLIAEASVCRDGHVDRLGDAVPERLQKLVFVLVATTLERVLLDRLPQQRRRPAVPGHEVRAESGLVVGIELGPVQGDPGFLALAEHEAHPGLTSTTSSPRASRISKRGIQ